MPYNTADFPAVEVPVVKIHRMGSVFSLGHITDFDPFRNLARRITEQPEEELRRMVYGARVVTGPDGLRQTQVVLREAADDITAARLDLPEEQIRQRLLDVIMGAEFVAPRKNERAHAERILDAFFEAWTTRPSPPSRHTWTGGRRDSSMSSGRHTRRQR